MTIKDKKDKMFLILQALRAYYTQGEKKSDLNTDGQNIYIIDAHWSKEYSPKRSRLLAEITNEKFTIQKFYIYAFGSLTDRPTAKIFKGQIRIDNFDIAAMTGEYIMPYQLSVYSLQYRK